MDVFVCFFSNPDSKKLAAIIEQFNLLQLTLTNLTLSITVTSGDTNEWGVIAQSWLFTVVCRVMLPIFALCCSYFAMTRFMSYWKFRRSTLPLVCLMIETITNLVRAVYCAIDPFLSQNIFPWQVSRMLVLITVPWSLSTSLLIGLCWAEALVNVTAIKAGFLSRYTIHFITFLVLLILLELFASIVHAFRLVVQIPIVVVISVLGPVAQLIVAFLFLIYGSKVLRILAKSVGTMAHRHLASKRKVELKRMTRRIFGSGVGMILFAVCSGLFGTPVVRSPYGSIFAYVGFYLGLQITSIFQIFAFSKPVSKASVVPEARRRSIRNSVTHSPSAKQVHGPLEASVVPVPVS